MRGTGIDSDVEIYATKQSKSETPVILRVIHHRQNPIESTLFKLSIHVPRYNSFLSGHRYSWLSFRDAFHNLDTISVLRFIEFISLTVQTEKKITKLS
jgi:hypothetical protein